MVEDDLGLFGIWILNDEVSVFVKEICLVRFVKLFLFLGIMILFFVWIFFVGVFMLLILMIGLIFGGLLFVKGW